MPGKGLLVILGTVLYYPRVFQRHRQTDRIRNTAEYAWAAVRAGLVRQLSATSKLRRLSTPTERGALARL